ncbi:MAG: hypothetical protein V1926_02780 [Candidatus Peregrinibacteria bacterium]
MMIPFVQEWGISRMRKGPRWGEALLTFYSCPLVLLLIQAVAMGVLAFVGVERNVLAFSIGFGLFFLANLLAVATMYASRFLATPDLSGRAVDLGTDEPEPLSGPGTRPVDSDLSDDEPGLTSHIWSNDDDEARGPAHTDETDGTPRG